jgi:outer membrane protein assembly factor BamB
VTKKLLSRGFLTRKLKSAVVILSAVLVVSFSATFTGFCVNAVSGDDWPMFQYDAAHTGYSTSTVTAINWTIAWSYLRQNPTSAYRTPAIADGYLYINDEDYLYCLNASSGTLKWNQSLTAPMHLATWAFSPTISGGYVYTHSAAYNASTGQLMFTYAEEGPTSPTVANGVIYIGSTRGGVVALSASTGAKIWNYTAGKLIYSPAVADGVVSFSSGDYFEPNNVYALDALTGRLLWTFTGIGGMYAPTVGGDGYVYLNGHAGIFYCFNALTGAKVWSYPIASAPYSVYSSPAVADGYVYAGFYALNASTGTPIWNNTELSGSSPALANGLVYVDYNGMYGNATRTPFTEIMYAFNASTGTEIWNYTFPGEYETYLVSSPAIAYGMVFIGAREALYAFGTAPSPTPSPSSPLNSPLSTLTVIVAVVVIVTLAVLFLVYRIRRKGAKSSAQHVASTTLTDKS